MVASARVLARTSARVRECARACLHPSVRALRRAAFMRVRVRAMRAMRSVCTNMLVHYYVITNML